MIEILTLAAAAWMGALFVAILLRLVRARSLATRILALDMLVLAAIALLAFHGYATGTAFLLDAALALALLSFATTLAAARLHARGRTIP